MEKLHAHKEQLAELQKLYNEYKSAVSNKMSDEDIETYRIAFYSLCDNYDWMDYVVAEGDCEKLVNIKDEVIVPPIYERLDCCENMVNDKKSPVVAYKNGKCGLVLPDGKGTQVSDFDYDCIERADRFFIVWKSGKFGVLNAKGEVLVPCSMDKVEFHPIYLNNDSNQAWYDDCMFEIFQNGKVGVLTADEVFVRPAFDRILFDDIVEADEALGAVCGDADGCVAVDGSLIPDEDFERFESKIIFTKDRYHHRASYNYELDVKMNYAQGLI